MHVLLPAASYCMDYSTGHHCVIIGAITTPGVSCPSRSLAAPSTPSTRIILRRAPLYGLFRTELHRAGIVASSPLVTRRINSSRRLRCATPPPQHSGVRGLGGSWTRGLNVAVAIT